MYSQPKELLRGMSKDFIKEFMSNSIEESHKKGAFIFREGERAGHLYILLEGQINIRIGDGWHMVSTVYHPGEVFGWSSTVGRDVYTATAECKKPTKLLKISAEKLQKILEKDQANGFIFYRRLAGILGDRLLHSYKMISCAVDLLIRSKVSVPEDLSIS
jgi:CRP-like cAMP-binding protein